MVKSGKHSKKTGSRSTCTLVLFMLFTLSVIFLFLVALNIFPLPISENEHDVLNSEQGSMNEKIDTILSDEKIDTAENHLSRSDVVDGPKQWMEILSWEPRVFLYHNFLSRDECEHLINLAKPHMQRSKVVDSWNGRSITSRVRTSYGTFLQRGQDEIISSIEKRIADVSFVPVENGESLQVLHYEVGQKYDPHVDFFLDKKNTLNGGQRAATMLMYLSDVKKGGETVFPRAAVNISTVLDRWNHVSKCARTGISVRPRMGDALLFWSMHPDTSFDALSLHGGCPVIQGNKWSATKWMHVDRYSV